MYIRSLIGEYAKLSIPQPLVIRALAHIGTGTATAATAAFWCAALGWYCYRIIPRVPHTAVSVFDFGETVLLAVACLAFQLAALRIGIEDITRIWNATVAPSPRPVRPARWRILGWIGALSWTAALGVGVPILTGLWHPDSTSLIFALVIILIPAVQCTGAAIVGPILTNVIQERESALEARLRIRAVAESAGHRHQQRVRHHGLR